MVRMPAGDCGSREARGGNEAKRAWRALGGLCLGTFVCFTNTTAFNIALPAISVSLGAGQVEQQWMVSAYNLVFGAFMLLAGSLGDRWGVKRTLLVGASAFAAASAAGVLATSSVTTIAARGVMGFGAGFSITMTLALITRLFESDGQVLALTMNAVAMTLGAPFGLVLGGLLVNLADWRAIFVFDLVAFLIVLLLDILLLPGDRSQSGGTTGARARLPLLSALLALAGLALVSAGLINAQISAASPNSWLPWRAATAVRQVTARRCWKSSPGRRESTRTAGPDASQKTDPSWQRSSASALLILPRYKSPTFPRCKLLSRSFRSQSTISLIHRSSKKSSPQQTKNFPRQ